MSNSDTTSLINGEGVSSSSPGAASTTLTVYSATIVSTTFVAEATESSSSSNGNSNYRENDMNTGNSSSNQSNSGNRTTVIVLATVMSIVGCILLAVAVWLVIRCRRRRSTLFARGITPIGDDEIETWKGQRTEKGLDMDTERSPPSPTRQSPHQKGHHKSASTTSIRKPPSVIVYARPSEEFSPMSPTYSFSKKISFDGSGKRSFDKELPFSPIQARAPNAREGLTDEAVPGDEPFVGSPKRRGSRLSKQVSSARYPHVAGTGHARTKSSRSTSSLHRLGASAVAGGGGYGYESDDYHRPSHEFYPGHSRVSSTQDPPRLSLSEQWPGGSAGLSPRPFIRAEDIGRAIG